jgi:hypothetical protein
MGRGAAGAAPARNSRRGTHASSCLQCRRRNLSFRAVSPTGTGSHVDVHTARVRGPRCAASHAERIRRRRARRCCGGLASVAERSISSTGTNKHPGLCSAQGPPPSGHRGTLRALPPRRLPALAPRDFRPALLPSLGRSRAISGRAAYPPTKYPRTRSRCSAPEFASLPP